MPRSAFAARFARGLFASALPLLAAMGACSQTPKAPGQLVVAIDTDMALPRQVDVIELIVSVNGTPLLDNPLPVGQGVNSQPIPATLTLVAGSDPNLPVTIRVVGWRNNQPRTLRQIVTPIPADRVAVLRMPVQWLCDGTVQATAGSGDDAGAGAGYASTCGAGFTCAAGSCVPSKIDPTTLESYTPQGVFGGASAPPDGAATAAGACFDTVACLATGAVVTPDAQCTVALPAGGGGVNVGLRVNDDGICDATGTTCFVPLDGNSAEGWTTKQGRIALPPAVCTKVGKGEIAGVVVSTTCPTKTVSTPPCGPWSSVAPAPDAAVAMADAAKPVPTVPSLVATLGSEAGALTPCCPLMADATTLYTCLCSGTSPVALVSVDPSLGTSARIATFAPSSPRARYSTALAGGQLYWVDRQQGGDAGVTCPVYATSVADGGASTLVGTVNGDVYDGADVLVDPGSLYVLADNVSGLASSASPVQLLGIDRAAGTVTAHDTGGARPVLQFAQDGANVYVGVDSDADQGDAGVQRTSTILAVPKGGAPPATVAQTVLATSSSVSGGYIGLVDDGSTLYGLFQAARGADGKVDTQIQQLGAPGAKPQTIYDEVADPAVSQLRLLGAVGGAVVFVRDVAASGDGGASSPESSVLVLPAGKQAPRIVAGFVGDTPVFALQAPSFTADVFWMNASGRVFRLPAPALQ